MNNSTITLIGNVTNDPEVRYGENGKAKISFGIAVDRSWKEVNSSEWKKETSFFNVIGWEPVSSEAARVLSKGVRVTVSGRLTQRSYETKEGEKRSAIEVVADEIGVSVRSIEGMTRRTANANGTASDTGGSRPSAPQRKAPVVDDEPF